MKKIITITGPSGSGKTTIANMLKNEGIPELVSHTTRAIRTGEVADSAYHFVSADDFSRTEMIESSEYAGNQYGLSKKEVDEKLSKHDVVVFVTDIHGMRQVKTQYPAITKTVFLEVTMDEMEERMRNRGDSESNIEFRLKNAINNLELENGQCCDFIVRNNILANAVETLLQISKKEEL